MVQSLPVSFALLVRPPSISCSALRGRPEACSPEPRAFFNITTAEVFPPQSPCVATPVSPFCHPSKSPYKKRQNMSHGWCNVFCSCLGVLYYANTTLTGGWLHLYCLLRIYLTTLWLILLITSQAHSRAVIPPVNRSAIPKDDPQAAGLAPIIS